MGEIENPCFSLWQKFLTPSVADITLAPIGTETSILKSGFHEFHSMNWQSQAISQAIASAVS